MHVIFILCSRLLAVFRDDMPFLSCLWRDQSFAMIRYPTSYTYTTTCKRLAPWDLILIFDVAIEVTLTKFQFILRFLIYYLVVFGLIIFFSILEVNFSSIHPIFFPSKFLFSYQCQLGSLADSTSITITVALVKSQQPDSFSSPPSGPSCSPRCLSGCF